MKKRLSTKKKKSVEENDVVKEIKFLHQRQDKVVNKFIPQLSNNLLETDKKIAIINSEIIKITKINEETAKNVRKITELMLETPINGYGDMKEALTQISHVTEGLRDRWSFWNALRGLKQSNKPLYYFFTYIIVASTVIVGLVHINALLHPFGYAVDFISSAKTQKVVVMQDSTKVNK